MMIYKDIRIHKDADEGGVQLFPRVQDACKKGCITKLRLKEDTYREVPMEAVREGEGWMDSM